MTEWTPKLEAPMRASIKFALCILVFLSDPALASEHFNCSTPKGKRVEWGSVLDINGKKIIGMDDGAQWTEDGFSNITPKIVIDATTLQIDWDNALPSDVSGLVNNDVAPQSIPIAGRDENSVWGFRAQSNTVEIFRFYYKYNLLYRITSSVGLALPKQAEPKPTMAAIYIAKCEKTEK